MVFSASSTTSLLGNSGDSAYYLKRTVLFGIVGLFVMRILSKRGVALLKPLTPLIMIGSLIGLFAVLLPGIGMEVNGAKRWIGAGLFQIQPSEIAKVALVLYAAAMLAERPKLTRSVARHGAGAGGAGADLRSSSSSSPTSARRWSPASRSRRC